MVWCRAPKSLWNALESMTCIRVCVHFYSKCEHESTSLRGSLEFSILPKDTSAWAGLRAADHLVGGRPLYPLSHSPLNKVLCKTCVWGFFILFLKLIVTPPIDTPYQFSHHQEENDSTWENDCFFHHSGGALSFLFCSIFFIFLFFDVSTPTSLKMIYLALKTFKQKDILLIPSTELHEANHPCAS